MDNYARKIGEPSVAELVRSDVVQLAMKADKIDPAVLCSTTIQAILEQRSSRANVVNSR